MLFQKRKCGFLALLMACVMFFSMSGVADASSFYYRKGTVSTGSLSFSKSWKKNSSLKWNTTCGGLNYTVGSMLTYGYDKGLFSKEDFVKNVGGQPTGWSCCGYVINSKGTYAETAMISGNRIGGEVEVKHTGGSVEYGVYIKIVV